MTALFKTAVALIALPPAGRAAAPATFYDGAGHQRRSPTAAGPVNGLMRYGFNDRAPLLRVRRGDGPVREGISGDGRCAMLREGRYLSLAPVGRNDGLSPVRAVVHPGARGTEGLYSPAQVADHQRQVTERWHEAQSVETRPALAGRGGASGPSAVAGALLGACISHQTGSDFGRDIAAIFDVAGGAALHANVGRDSQTVVIQDVRRCGSVAGQAHTADRDLACRFRGQHHRLPVIRPPGATVTVNRQGEARV